MTAKPTYHLLPFRFQRFGPDVLLVNDVGQYHFLPDETFHDLLQGRLRADSDVAADLESSHFICGSDLGLNMAS